MSPRRPARNVDPFVEDELQYERWMLVTDAGGGGSMTGLGFDESVFADSLAPVPGPFRIRSSHRATTGQTALLVSGWTATTK